MPVDGDYFVLRDLCGHLEERDQRGDVPPHVRLGRQGDIMQKLGISSHPDCYTSILDWFTDPWFGSGRQGDIPTIVRSGVTFNPSDLSEVGYFFSQCIRVSSDNCPHKGHLVCWV